MEFSSIDELKERLTPALKIRVRELKRKNINLTVDELWSYFIRIWKDKQNLTLATLVDDILNKEII
ncbi:MAG: hypothetical protein IKP79_01390 [Bacilli bacterium]|nr:hypothetical protein [Bacilli bacterium]